MNKIISTILLFVVVNVSAQVVGNTFVTNASLDNLWLKVQTNADGIESREVFAFLLEATASNWDQQKLNTALINLTSMQFRDQSDPYYGNFIFTKGPRPGNIDENAVEFCMEQGAVLRMYYYDKLNNQNKSLLDELIRLSIIAILRHQVDITYTNIYVMKTWNLVALGESMGLNIVSQEGYSMLDQWINSISVVGIPEYNSPTYSGVLATNLGLLARHTKNPEAKSKANVAMEFLSYYLFANYFKMGMYLGGPHSRDYNYEISQGNIDQLMGNIISGQSLSFYLQHAVWKPTQEALDVLNKTSRLIICKTGVESEQNFISYIGNKFNIGSSGTPYGYQDKNLVVNIANSTNKLIVNTSYVIEGREDPYGLNPLVTSQGHTKSFHLAKYLIARAQNKNDVVFFVAADGKDRSDTKRLQSHVIIPSSKINELWNGNTKLTSWSSLTSMDLTSEKCFFIKCDNVAVGIRFLLVKDVFGVDIPVTLYNDNISVSAGKAMRLTATHSATTPDSEGVIAMWWRAEEGIGSDAAFTTFRNNMIATVPGITISGDLYTIKVMTPNGELGIKADKSSLQMIENYGNISLPESSVMSVDGVDISSAIFSKSALISTTSFESKLINNPIDKIESVYNTSGILIKKLPSLSFIKNLPSAIYIIKQQGGCKKVAITNVKN